MFFGIGGHEIFAADFDHVIQKRNFEQNEKKIDKSEHKTSPFVAA